MTANVAALLYLVSGVLFIMALRGLSSPVTSRMGNIFGMVGMTIAILTTLTQLGDVDGAMTWFLILAGLGIGGSIGAYMARTIAMTMMPELSRRSTVSSVWLLSSRQPVHSTHPKRLAFWPIRRASQKVSRARAWLKWRSASRSVRSRSRARSSPL